MKFVCLVFFPSKNLLTEFMLKVVDEVPALIIECFSCKLEQYTTLSPIAVFLGVVAAYIFLNVKCISPSFFSGITEKLTLFFS